MYYNIWGCGQPNWDGNGNSRGYGDYFGETGMECEFAPTGLFAAMYFVVYMCTVAFLILNLFIGALSSINCSPERRASLHYQSTHTWRPALLRVACTMHMN